MSINKFELGQIIEFEGNRWQIVGDDSTSDPHPAGQYEKWDYLLKRTDNGEYKRVTKEELKDTQLIGEK